MSKTKRSALRKAVRDPQGPFTARSHRDRSRYERKMKHKNKNRDW